MHTPGLGINRRNMIGHRNRNLNPTYHNQGPSTSYGIHPLSHQINTPKFHTIVVQNRFALFLAGKAAPCIHALAFPEILNHSFSLLRVKRTRGANGRCCATKTPGLTPQTHKGRVTMPHKRTLGDFKKINGVLDSSDLGEQIYVKD